MKPTQILSKLCKDGKIDPPIYSQGKVQVGKHSFVVKPEDAERCDFTKGEFVPVSSPTSKNLKMNSFLNLYF